MKLQFDHFDLDKSGVCLAAIGRGAPGEAGRGVSQKRGPQMAVSSYQALAKHPNSQGHGQKMCCACVLQGGRGGEQNRAFAKQMQLPLGSLSTVKFSIKKPLLFLWV